MELQLVLFPKPPHTHTYEVFKGPHTIQPRIPDPGGNGKGWCWTCGEWVNNDGLTSWQRCKPA